MREKNTFLWVFSPSSSLPSSSICYMFTLLMVPSHSQSLLFSSICVFIAGNKIFLICIQIIFTHFKKKWPRKRAKRRKTGCAKWWTGNKQFVTCQICSFYLNFIQIRWPWFAIIFFLLDAIESTCCLNDNHVALQKLHVNRQKVSAVSWLLADSFYGNDKKFNKRW